MSAFGWAIITAAIWGIVPLLEKAGLDKTSPLVGLFYRSLGVVMGILLLTIFMVRPAQIRQIDWRSAILLILGGFLASFVGQMCFYNGLKTGEVSRMVPISGSYPFITFLLGVLIFGESISPLKILGVLLMILGMWALRIG